MSDNQSNKNYSVGYKKPPKHGQFKKGQSGNPRGRPRKSDKQIVWPKEYRFLFMRALNQFIKVKEGDKAVDTTKIDVIIRRLIEVAMKGNMRVAMFLLKEFERHAREEEDIRVRMQALAYELDDAQTERDYQALLREKGKTEAEYPRPWPHK